MQRFGKLHQLERLHRQIDGLFVKGKDGWGGRGDCLAYHPGLFGALLHGYIRMRLVRLPSAALAYGLRKRQHGGSNEGATHFAMKHAAAEWMRGEGAKDAAAEASCMCGRSDAYSASKLWVVECGDTRIGKLLSAASHPQPVRFTLIPFQHVFDDSDEPRGLLGVDFSWPPGIEEWMREYAWEIRQDMAERQAEARAG